MLPSQVARLTRPIFSFLQSDLVINREATQNSEEIWDSVSECGGGGPNIAGVQLLTIKLIEAESEGEYA